MTLITTSRLVDGNLLDGADGVETVDIGGRTFMFVSARDDDRVITFEVFPDGTFIERSTFQDGSTTSLNFVAGLTAHQIGGATYLYAAAEFDDALTVFSVANDGSLSVVQTISDDAMLELDGTNLPPTIVTVGASTFLVATGFRDNGLSVFRIGSNGQLTNVTNLDDSQQLGFGLDGAAGTMAVQIGGRTFLLVTGFDDDAISVFEMSATGALTLRSSLADSGTLELNGALEVEHVTTAQGTFIYVAGNADSGISVFRLGATGGLTPVADVFDDANTPLSNVRDLEVYTSNGQTFLAASAQSDDTLTIFSVGVDGGLTVAQTINGGTSTIDNVTGDAFDGIESIQTIEIAGQTFLAVTSVFNNSVSLLQVDPQTGPINGTANNDILLGTDRDDEMDGLGGNDVILGRDGDDVISGGQDDDFVVGANGNDTLTGDGDLTQTVSDIVTVTETGNDLALNITLPDAADGSTIDVSGIVSRTTQVTSAFNLVYVIDVSGSMGSQFSGTETVGDLNGDGRSNELIDGTIAAYTALNQSVIDAGFAASSVSIVTFNSGAVTVFDGSAGSGVPATLRTLDSGGGTNFERALQETIRVLTNSGPGENRVFFMSDGANGGGTTSFADEVQTLINSNGLDAEIRSIGLGAGASLGQLDLVDDGLANNSAIRVLTPSALTAGLIGSPVATTEVDRLEVYVNNVLVQTVPSSQFVDTPLGLQYNATIGGLSSTAGDTIRVVLIASDTAGTSVDVELTVPQGVVSEGDDVLLGEAGNDLVQGNGGNDTLQGGAGDDALFGGTGNDTMHGGVGDDGLRGEAGNDAMIGGAGADTMVGGLGNDTYYLDALDTVDESSGGGFDILAGYLNLSVNDTAFLGDFEGVRLLGSADLTATGNAQANRLEGNDGDNDLNAGGGNDTLLGGEGNDTLRGGSGNDRLFGQDGGDLFFSGDGNDRAEGGNGQDAIFGDGGNDTIAGGNGFDTIRAGDDDDRVDGGNQADNLYGDAGNDNLTGGQGLDRLFGGTGNDTLAGGADGDGHFGEAGNDVIRGGDGNDRAFGGSGNDTILGEAGNDTLLGGSGFDRIIGGSGNDAMAGNFNADTFIFTNGFGQDTITDFDASSSLERIDLSGVTGIVNFADLVANHLQPFGNGNTVIRDGVNTIQLNGVNINDLDASDFIF